jgi:hypothetical protein
VIEGNIVFVLGAGASNDFKFPLGYELVDMVLAKFGRNRTGRPQLLTYSGCDEVELDVFLEALDGSAQNSVDAFLEYRREFMKIGKAAIAYCLIECEDPVQLYRTRSPTGHWLRYLLGRMRGKTFEDFAENKVGFITFNYDRTLEYFLCRAHANTFGKTEEEAAQIIKTIPIIHVHGQLGYLPAWGEKNARPFWLQVNESILRMCVEEIKIMHEGADVVTPEYERARHLLAKASNVYFLGVGFNGLNLERLAVRSLKDNIAYATCIGLNNAEAGLLQSQLGGKLTIFQNCDCLTMLRQHVSWT